MQKRKEIPTPKQAVELYRARRKRQRVEAFRNKCLKAIQWYFGKPIEVSTAGFTLEVIETVEKELNARGWKTRHESEFEGSNPRLKIAEIL